MGKVRGASLKIFNVKTYWVTSLFTKEEKQKPVVLISILTRCNMAACPKRFGMSPGRISPNNNPGKC